MRSEFLTVPDTVSAGDLRQALVLHHRTIMTLHEMLTDLDLREVAHTHLCLLVHDFDRVAPALDSSSDELWALEENLYTELMQRIREIEGR